MLRQRSRSLSAPSAVGETMPSTVVATAFEEAVPYDYWLQHACGERGELIYQATTNLDGSPRPTYPERMRDCPRCWAETNTEDVLLWPGVGRPFPVGARGTNCLELGADEAVPEWLWRKFEGEFKAAIRAPTPTTAPTRRHTSHPPRLTQPPRCLLLPFSLTHSSAPAAHSTQHTQAAALYVCCCTAEPIHPLLEAQPKANPKEVSPSSLPSGEFQLVDKFGDDERPYLESQGTDWFTLWAFANVAHFGLGSHTSNRMGPDGSSLDFHIWFPCVEHFLLGGWRGTASSWHLFLFGAGGVNAASLRARPVA